MSICNIEHINPHILKCGYLGKASCPPPGTDYGLRCVKWHEIELITWGEGEIITEGTIIPTGKGSIFFRSPGMKVRGISPYHCYIVVFDITFDPLKKDEYADTNHFLNDDKLIGTFQRNGNFCGLTFPDVLKTSRFEQYLELFKNIYNEWVYQSKVTVLYTKSLLMQILIKAYEEYTSEGTLINASRSIQLNHTRVTAARVYIDNNPRKWFTLAELASYSGLSRNFFCRIFRDIIGVTPVEYINRQKINAAKKLLIETNYSIKAIAYELGFENDTYFYSMFKNKAGLTPTDYRQKQRPVYQTVW